MKSPKNTTLYSRLALITSVTLVVGYFVVYAVYQNIEPEEVASNAIITSTLMGKIKNNLDTLNTQVTDLTATVVASSIWSKVGSDINYTAGKIGIGTVSPNSDLHAYNGTTNAEIDLQSIAGTNKHWGIYNDRTNNSLKFWNNDIVGEKNAVTILNNGNVGIGTVSPGVKLDISGTDAIRLPVGSTAQRPGSPASGMIRVNSTLNQLEYWDGYNWLDASEQSSYITANGGTITTDGNYKIHTFTTNGTLTVTNIIGAGTVEYLIVGGGGGGGAYWGGGGGAGGILAGSTKVTNISYSIVVGAGGLGKTDSLTWPSVGGNSTALGLTAYGGGGGAPGQADATFARNGGSGGGGGGFNGRSYAGRGTNGQGTNGGEGAYYGATTFQMGGGGGGALLSGINAATGNGPVGAGGGGGTGITSSISGSPVVYGGGGGGGTGYSSAGGTGGAGGGGTGGHSTSQGQNATANSGGGGGGGGINSSTYYYGGNGGSGIVVIRYRFQ